MAERRDSRTVEERLGAYLLAELRAAEADFASLPPAAARSRRTSAVVGIGLMVLAAIVAIVVIRPVLLGGRGSADASVTDGPFRLEFSLTKLTYLTTEPIEGIATLSVTDGLARTLGGPGGSPIGFSMVEVGGTRHMDQFWRDKCAPYRVGPNSPLTTPLTKSGGWAGDDPDAAFYQQFFADPEIHLPPGTWDISVVTDFFDDSACNGTHYELKATIRIEVRTEEPTEAPRTPEPTRTAIPTWPVEAERLPTALDSAPDARLTCGFPDHTFPLSALDSPTGVEDESGPLLDALRAAIELFGFTPEEIGGLSWFLAEQDEGGALFLARGNGDPGWWYALVEPDGGGWKPAGMGGCNLNVQLTLEYLPAQWALDPAYPAPDASATELHLLVWELACSGASPTTGRMSAPVVEYAEATVTITIGVRPLEGAQTCPLGQGTPAIVTLPQPLGTRTFLDGYRYPAVEPVAPFG